MRTANSYFNKMMNPKPPQKPAKAGIMIHGNNAGGQHCLLVGYNEGRFAKKGRCYVLTKGSIDNGEPPIDAALREFYEESGVDLATFLGPENIARLKLGDRVENLTHPDFPGVRIIAFDPHPYPHTYHSRAGVLQDMVMYGVKVEGIENLKPHLKNKEGISLDELLEQKPANVESERLLFPTFYQWLCQGYIPGNGVQERVDLIDPQYFSRLVKCYAREGKIERRKDWQQFCGDLPKNDYKALRKCFSLIKDRLLVEGWIEGDRGLLKFDEKDCPLHYYAEGAYIGSAVEILTKTLTDMQKNKDYAKAFGGEGSKIGINPKRRIQLGQVAAYSPFVTEDEWRQAYGKASGKQNTPPAGLRSIIAGGAVRTAWWGC